MKIAIDYVLMIFLLSIFGIACKEKSNAYHNDCITTDVKKSSENFINCFRDLGGCEDNFEEHLDNYCYCEASCFNVYELSSRQEFYLIEILKGVGKTGKDYWIIRKLQAKWKSINYFTGYLTCILPRKDFPSDIIFKSETDNGNITIRLTLRGKYYIRKAIIDVEGSDVTSSNKQDLLIKYNLSSGNFGISREEY
ncbi:hypothetical protein CAP35_05790 [Chitinophagaceae bacterium IBVUCB1]|nr:hypothetical protein CAP35_05790 [Chitinophagaceae bacterium IBVUCB1]